MKPHFSRLAAIFGKREIFMGDPYGENVQGLVVEKIGGKLKETVLNLSAKAIKLINK